MLPRILLIAATALAAACTSPGDMEIRSAADGEPVTVRTSARFAGAVSSLVFRGVEYIDVHDHGRELQSASSFDGLGECYNPTEAGNRDDRIWSTSRLLGAASGPNWLQTWTDMAFWLTPGATPHGPCGTRPEVRLAANQAERGRHVLTKRIAFQDASERLIAYDAGFFVPEAHVDAVFEAATAYLPKRFSARWLLDLRTGALTAATQQGEQSRPVILATPDRAHAMGVWSPGLPQRGLGYGLFEFPDVMKWNCVYREREVAAGATYRYRCYVAVGTLDEVARLLQTIAQRFAQSPKEANQ